MMLYLDIKKLLIIILAIVVSILGLVVFVSYLSGEINKSSSDDEVKQYDIPIKAAEKRGYLVGISGYTPADFPASSAQDINTYWDEIADVGELYGIHTDWKEIQIISTATRRNDMRIEVVLGFQDSDRWITDVDEYIETARSLLATHPAIKYFAIGNEVNFFYITDPNSFSAFLQSSQKIYDTLHEEFPDVQIFTTFNLERMKGEGYLMGGADLVEPQWHILERFESSVDFIAFTTFPYFDYRKPSNIPDNYYSEINKYWDKPVAFTEVGWPARESFGEKYMSLTTDGYVGSEKEQVEFLNRFIKLTSDLDLVFMNWIFLNDFQSWENGDEPVSLPLFDSIGLKYNNGEEKLIWNAWVKFKNGK